MTREHGINRENPGENKTFHLLQKGSGLQLVADFEISGDREIYGIAHVPAIDRENELILADAIRAALPQYMELPILHVQHTERPVGTVTKAVVDGEGKLHLYGKIKETPDTDDVWEDIKGGRLNKFSIFGKRLAGSPECSLSPGQRINPCITKSLQLFSISVVGDNAMNPETFLEVAKAYGVDGMEEEDDKKKEEDVEKCGTCPKKGDSEEEVEKSEEPTLAHEPSNISSIMGRIDGLEKAIEEMRSKKEEEESVEKSDDEEDEKVEDEKKEDVQKAAPTEPVTVEVKSSVETTPAPEYVKKADLSGYITKAELDTITKAMGELQARIEKMEKETIEKGGHVVVIGKEYIEDNPMIANHARIQ